jgi:CheY-like chemotaxis protein
VFNDASREELSGVHVLVVDDDLDSLDMMQAAFHSAGASVTAVSSAKKAIEALNRATPSVVVSDLKMPDEDGLTFARGLQTIPSLRSVPILAVTAYDQLYVRRELHDAGFVGILRKPPTPILSARWPPWRRYETRSSSPLLPGFADIADDDGRYDHHYGD